MARRASLEPAKGVQSMSLLPEAGPTLHVTVTHGFDTGGPERHLRGRGQLLRKTCNTRCLGVGVEYRGWYPTGEENGRRVIYGYMFIYKRLGIYLWKFYDFLNLTS